MVGAALTFWGVSVDLFQTPKIRKAPDTFKSVETHYERGNSPKAIKSVSVIFKTPSQAQTQEWGAEGQTSLHTPGKSNPKKFKSVSV